MALFPFIIHVEKKPGLSFGEIMRNARFWLDRHQIDATSFKPVTSAATSIGFDIGFKSEDEALRFGRAFAQHSSTDG